MKQLLFICLAFICLNCYGQKKDTLFKQSAIFDSTGARVCRYLHKTDTLDIDKVKFIRVNGQLIATESIKEPGMWLPLSALQKIFIDLQEYPAKCANPITQYLYKFFGIK